MEELNALMAARRKKLDDLREAGVNPYANNFKPTHTTADVNARFGDKSREELEGNEESFALAGRIMAVRVFGKAAFFVLQDRGGRLQFFVSKNDVGEETYKLFKSFDAGDIVGAVGTPFRTKTDELSIHVRQIQLLSKSLRPLPEKWHGLTDQETRYRQRYVDLTVNPDVVEVFRKRSAIVQQIRNYLTSRDFMEVETPMLHPLAGGAAAKPFTTHHNALDMDLFLRIAPELYLKRLIVGGLERVFEINRNFRNEGLSTRHNPEFTMLEFYWAYATYHDLMNLTEEMIGGMVKNITGSYTITYQEQELDFSPPWDRLTPAQAIVKYSAITAEELATREAMLAVANRLKIENAAKLPDGKLLMEIYEAVAEEKIVRPTFVIDFPIEVSPLARKKESNPRLVDRFEVIIAGREICNAFSELNDPIDQKERFEGQLKAREDGDDEAHMMDEDYIRALEFGMPPAAGEGIGIDRLTMILTDSPSIREVILFPQLRKEQP
jgi:lysyl-tRNA synthetase class 2